jgi:hypothetical protein
MYTLKKGTKCPLKTHNTNYGFWKSEIAKGWHVQSYTSLGPKNYSISEVSDNGEETRTTVKGTN